MNLKGMEYDFFNDWVRSKLEQKIWIGRGLGSEYTEIDSIKTITLKRIMIKIKKVKVKNDELLGLLKDFALVIKAELEGRSGELLIDDDVVTGDPIVIHAKMQKIVHKARSLKKGDIAICAFCKKKFKKHRWDQSFCSRDCGLKYNTMARRARYKKAKNEKK